MQSNHKNTFRTKRDGIYSRLMAKQWGGGNPIYGHLGRSNTHFLPKMNPNIGLMQITSQFGPFDNVK